jgi:predicted dehydrogenase
MSSKSIGVGVIGLGIMGRGYVQAFTEDPRTRVVAIADAIPGPLQAMQKEHDLPVATTDYHQLITHPDVDLVVVSTPHCDHFPMVIAALQAGKHVICEKPLAVNAEQAKQMIDLAEECQRQLFVGLNMRAVAQLQTVKKALDAGRIGRPFMARIAYLGNETKRMNDPNNWKGSYDKAGGGVLLDGGYHVIDIMNMFFGQPHQVSGVCSRAVVQASNKAEDNAIITMAYDHGLLAEVTASFTVLGENSKGEATLRLRVDVFGTQGCLWAEYYSHSGLGWQIKLSTGDDTIDLPVEPYEPSSLPKHFIDCLTSGAQPIVTAADALRVQQIVDTIYQQNTPAEVG